MGYVGVPYFQTNPFSIPVRSPCPSARKQETAAEKWSKRQEQPNANGYGCSMGDEFSDWVKVGT